MVNTKSNSIIYHKSSCITCKKTLVEIDRMKIDIQKRDFFKEPFSEIELKKIIKLSGLNPNELLRKRDKMYKELNLDSTKHTQNEIIKLMIKFPGLIKRPIIIKQNKAHVGKIDVKNIK
jgi:arsenate reductase